MCSTERTALAGRAVVRDAVLLGAAVSAIGASYGLLARAAGISPVMACAMSVLIFAGGSQFLLVATAATGGSVAAGVLAALLLNARHVPFGISLAPLLRGNVLRRALASQLVIDESTAFALAQPTPERSRRAFFAAGLSIFVFWQLGTVVGTVAGGVLGDPRTLGLDAAFPAGILALLASRLGARAARIAAAGGAAAALATTPVLPAGGPIVLAAGAGLVVAAALRGAP
jgi:4-azaleucine resistance transporter AzlC